MPVRRPLSRFVRKVPARATELDRLAGAIQNLSRSGGTGDPFLLANHLQLLVGHLGASLATLVMVTGGVAETRWWAPEAGHDEAPPCILPFCEWLLANPERMLAIQDMAKGPHLPSLQGLGPLPWRAVLGVALRQGDAIRAMVFAKFDQPTPFRRTDYALMDAVGEAIGRVLEVEDLKQSLTRLEDALAITQAVMEDSSIRDPETDLPNLRYLEVWEKAMLGSDHRPSQLVVAECQFRVKGRKDISKVRKAAEGLRAGDLVVRVAPDRFQIIFQHTPRSLAHIQLLRLRTQLDGAPMGATLWLPGPDGLGLPSCQPRLVAALEESRGMGQPALVWHLPEGFTEGPPLPAHKAQAPATPERAQAWQPPVLRRV